MALSRSRKSIVIISAVVALVVGVRLALPTIVEGYVNRQLDEIPDYTGQVADVDLSLWRGAYQIQGLVIEKETAAEQGLEPFVLGDTMDLSVEWRSLLNGEVVAELILAGIEVNMIEAPEPDRSQTGEEVPWQEKLEEFFPFRFNSIIVRDSLVRFRTPGIAQDDAMVIGNIHGEMRNLTNAAEAQTETFAPFNLTAHVLNAPVRVSGRVDPTAVEPRFDVNLTLEEVDLTQVNPWMREYLNADAQSGTFALYMELAASKGEFEGYAKPIINDLEILDPEENTEGILQRLWEAGLGLVTELLENQPEDQLASQVPLSGSVESPEAGIASAIFGVLRNAFVEAFTHSLEYTISLPLDDEEEGDEEEEARTASN